LPWRKQVGQPELVEQLVAEQPGLEQLAEWVLAERVLPALMPQVEQAPI
jgi:hypothetical protein